MSEPIMLVEALKMGKHGVYVWSSYFIYAAFILGWSFKFKTMYKAQIDQLFKKQRRAVAYEQQSSLDRSSAENEV